MRIFFVLFLATLGSLANVKPSSADPFDVAFWEAVIESPICNADEFVAFLKDPRAWAHCPRRGDRGRSRHGELLHRLCGAGLQIVERSACFRKNPGQAGRQNALECLEDNARWNASWTIWLEDFGNELPNSSRLRLNSEPESREMPKTLLAITPLPPRVLGLSEQDLADESRALEFWTLATKVKYDRVEATLSALPAAQEILSTRTLNFPDRRSVIESLREVHRSWNSKDGRLRLQCEKFASGKAFPDVTNSLGWTASCQERYLLRSAGSTFRAVEMLGVPY